MNKMVKQRYEYDCVLCCIAMMADKPYEDIFPKAFCERIEELDGCTNEDTNAAFKLVGLERDVDYKCVYCDHMDVHTIRQMLWKRRAMIQVNSLNYEKGMHCIYWDGEQIFDPSNKQVYRWLSNLHPICVWIFEERSA